LTTLLTCAAEPQTKNAVLEIFETLSDQDSKSADFLQEEQLGYLLQILVSELMTSNGQSRRVALTIIANLSSSSNLVRSIMLQHNVLSTLQTFITDSSVLIQIIAIVRNLAIVTTAKAQIRESGLLTLLIDLLVSSHAPEQSISKTNEPVFDLLQVEPQKPVPPSLVNFDEEKTVELEQQLIGALVTLSYSELNREAIHQNSTALSIVVDILVNHTTTMNETNTESELLFNTLALIDNLLFDSNCREYFHSCQILRPLFSVLSSSASQRLTSQILTLIQKLTHDERNNDIVRDNGMMPLVSSMSNPNEYIVTQALLIISNLIRFDASREMVRTYVDKAVLEELLVLPNVTIQQLAHSIKHILGL